MAWYAYCIAERQAFPDLDRHRKPVPLPNVSGVQGNQVFLFPSSDLAVVVSEHEGALDDAAELGQQAQREHARVIADVFHHTTVLPFRFHTVFDDDEALRRSVRSNQRHFLEDVERLRGKAEMHIKLTVDDCCPRQLQAVAAHGVGKEYLSSLREGACRQRDRQSKARALSVQMHRMFLPLAEEVSCRRTETGKILLDIAHLIEHKSVERYQNKYSTALQDMKECSLQLSGPWPPYHFVAHRNGNGNGNGNH